MPPLDRPSRRPIIGVMGPGAATPELLGLAEELGRLIARAGWITLSGGRDAGVMAAVNRGAKSAGGLTVGILPNGDCRGVSAHVDIPIITAMGSARNNINVLSSDVVIACGMGRGVAAEVALALKAEKKVILLACPAAAQTFFRELGGDLVSVADAPAEAVALCAAAVKNFK
ncbi:MAG: cytochrome [Pseudomonadota bacterium]|nr:cytochrome [Pseudomonadota bacterium]